MNSDNETKNLSEYLVGEIETVYYSMHACILFQIFNTASTYGAQCFHWEYQLVSAGFQKHCEDWSQQSPCPPALQKKNIYIVCTSSDNLQDLIKNELI